MAKKIDIEIHNEDVREIMKEIPGSLIRWGLTIIFLVCASIFIGSYFFTFKEIITAPMIITTTNPPAPIISKVSGRIGNWYISDGQKVNKGDNIALIQNSANIDDINEALEIIYLLDTQQLNNDLFITDLPEDLSLGELQDTYNLLCQNWQDYKNYVKNSFSPQKAELLKEQMEKQMQHHQLMIKQQLLMKKELEIARKELIRFNGILNKGGVSESQLEEAKARVIQSERNYTGFLASLKTTEINIINQKRTLLELQEQHQITLEQFELSISGNIKSLKKHFENWKEKYLLRSPIHGRVTLTKYWSENHVASTGQRIATVVPIDNSSVICKAIVPSSGIGKVEIGHVVHIKLAGYPYMQHGILTGNVSTISLVPEEQGYIVEIRLTDGMMSSYSEQLKFIQEMEGTAEIITKEMRAIYRFINPLKMLFN